MTSWYFLDVLRMFAGFFQDVFRMLRWVLWAWWDFKWSFQMKVWTSMTQKNSMIPSYSMIPAILWSQLFDDPQLFDDLQPFVDPQLFDDQLELEVWTLIIQNSTVIRPSPMVLFWLKCLQSTAAVFSMFSELGMIHRWRIDKHSLGRFLLMVRTIWIVVLVLVVTF